MEKLDKKNVDQVVSTFKEDAARLKEIANQGFAVALNIMWAGPIHDHSEYPEEWSQLYFQKNFFILDPMFYWTLTKRGHLRWSECNLPDVSKVLQKAAKHGLKFGVTLSERETKNRHLLSLARDDREFNDQEIEEIESIFKRWIKEASVTSGEQSK